MATNGSSIVSVLNQKQGDRWAMYHGDSIEVLKGVPDNSIHYQIFSLPFESLYTYSATERDLGNCRNSEEFWSHYEFLIREQMRAHIPGRLISIHCMDLPINKERQGYIGLRDFRGEIIRAYERAGFIYHSNVTIWKNPVTAMQRTKALGLLHKQLVKDSCMSRQGIPDYLVTMRKPGTNPEPVAGPLTYYVGDDPTMSNGNHGWNPEFPRISDEARESINIWQRYASPIWMDIDPSDTLQRESAREEKDERHICPLQLQVIERAVQLWTNPNDIIFDPFTGIGSTGYVGLKRGRRFVGIELKESYFKQAVGNLKRAENFAEQDTLFAQIA